MKRPYKIRPHHPNCAKCHPETCSATDCKTKFVVALGVRELAVFDTRCAAEQWCHNTGRNCEWQGSHQ